MAIVAPVASFVFRPGGTAGNNVFTDWPSLMTALGSVEGRKILEFDDSALTGGKPCLIPPGTHPMRDVMWAGFGPKKGAPRSNVAIVEGARFTELRMIGGQITIDNRATTTSPIDDFVDGGAEANHIQIGMRDDCGNTQIMNSGTAPLFDFGKSNVLLFAQNCLLGIDIRNGPLHPLIRQKTGGVLTINLIGQSQVGQNLVASEIGATMRFGALSSATQIAVRQDTILGSNDFAPVTRIQRKVRPRPPLAPTKTALAVDTFAKPNELLRCDGHGEDGQGFTQPLPQIKGGFSVRAGIPLYTGGQEIVVAEVAGGKKLSVQASSGDTIDGSAAAVRFRAHESRIFASDGESDWITIASHNSRGNGED
jgi:hypothetical protein